MSDHQNVWGIHMGTLVGFDPIENGYVGIGWVELGNLSQIPKNRDRLKKQLLSDYPTVKAGAIPVWAGVLLRFVYEMSIGDIIIYPSKTDRMVNIGKITGDYYYDASDDGKPYPNRRPVQWLKHLPRDQFSQAALYEIGSAVTLFAVRTYTDEFVQTLDPTLLPKQQAAEPPEDDDTVTSEASSKAEESTSDFIIKRLKNNLTAYEFEKFIAHLLECMGYHARVTQKSGDGGVDVIAHRDELGFEPPVIKVQCKQITSSSGDPDVNQLLGTIGDGEYALFVNLGSFTKQAKATERNKSKLRLIDGDQLVELVLENYTKLAPRYRAILPLKQIYVADV